MVIIFQAIQCGRPRKRVRNSKAIFLFYLRIFVLFPVVVVVVVLRGQDGGILLIYFGLWPKVVLCARYLVSKDKKKNTDATH